ncbi:MAG TPA: selenocysteine-specific translation elongation factor [Gemmatimonadales bacterium]|nr:selenocysteine-specific translation elongation factor [Gemmatimonadales bacterium]
MDRHVVIGTAGHIDHGKTALVKALTGVDTDRLEEEKRRGITIDLGFAPLALGDVAASVVDVPGHEGFIRNMVAGATGVDLALLVVAADEGVMPQTTEHLAILRFLGVARGVVALTKCDLAPDAAWRELVAEEIGAKVTEAFGRPWPIVEVSATALTGLEELKRVLAAEARSLAARAVDDRFRLPVDRAFALAGAGTIVTGTLWSGSAAEGDRLTALPAGVEARVRSIEVHGQAAPKAEPGRRVALALVGVSRDQVERGAVVVSGEGWTPSRAMDVSLTMLPEGAPRLQPRVRVRVHHGTAEVLARVVLPPDADPRGARVGARLLLESPVVARSGDRFVLRSYSPVTTIGGGIVVDPGGWRGEEAKGRRRTAAPIAELPATDADLVALLVRRRGPQGLARAALEVVAGMDRPRLASAVAAALQAGLVESGGWLVAAEEVNVRSARLSEALDRFHGDHPLESGMPIQSWRAAAGAVPRALVDLAERALEAASRVQRDASLVRTTGWTPHLVGRDQQLRQTLLAALERAGGEPPSVAELEAQHPLADVAGLLRMMAREGLVVAVGKDRFYEAGALRAERDRIVTALTALGAATPAALRERLGRSRKWLIPLLEWCDTQGITLRRGDERVLSGAQRS